MTTATKTVQRTYFMRFSELDQGRQFHFASRLYSWSRDSTSKTRLEELRSSFLPDDEAAQLSLLHYVRQELPELETIHAYKDRAPYFEKYPLLREASLVMFRLRHWKHLFGTDKTYLLFDVYKKEDLDKLASNLQKDTEAIQTLSTFAINYLYLYNSLFLEESKIEPQVFLDIGASSPKETAIEIQLFIYLYTHCIIGESLFYHQPVRRHLSEYTQMLEEMEEVISRKFELVNLDNKFEFLVCAQLCGFETKLRDKIYTEALGSVHQDGYIVDVQNKNIHPAKQDFITSEHRNVLFLMSRSKPHFLEDS